MASAGASGTVTVEDQRTYIKIETLRGQNPTENHNVLREVCGEQTVDRSTVFRWATSFREGRVSMNDDLRPGRPKTSTDERSVKLCLCSPRNHHDRWSSMWNKCNSSVLSSLDAKIAQKNAQNRN
jgi:hypothetical protein